MNSTNWDNRFLDMAKLVSTWSKDPSTKVGAVIVDPSNRLVSVGYNGFPKDITDNERLLDRGKKYDIIVHAEVNSILFSNKTLKGCTMYTWPFQPCPRCAGLIIQSGIRRVVSVDNKNPRWVEDFVTAKQLLLEASVRLDIYNEQ
jgi:dCMP deaminase